MLKKNVSAPAKLMKSVKSKAVVARELEFHTAINKIFDILNSIDVDKSYSKFYKKNLKKHESDEYLLNRLYKKSVSSNKPQVVKTKRKFIITSISPPKNNSEKSKSSSNKISKTLISNSGRVFTIIDIDDDKKKKLPPYYNLQIKNVL